MSFQSKGLLEQLVEPLAAALRIIEQKARPSFQSLSVLQMGESHSKIDLQFPARDFIGALTEKFERACERRVFEFDRHNGGLQCLVRESRRRVVLVRDDPVEQGAGRAEIFVDFERESQFVLGRLRIALFVRLHCFGINLDGGLRG